MALTRTNDHGWMCVRMVGGGCVIIILICWLWLSGRLPAEQAHLVNETSRSREIKRWKRGGGKKRETEREKRGVSEKGWKQGKRKDGEKDIWRQWEPPRCSSVWWNVELMRSWRSTTSPPAAAAVASIHSSHLPLPFPFPPGSALTANLAAELRHQWSRSEIPFSPRGF